MVTKATERVEQVRDDLSALDAMTFTSRHVLDRLPAIFESQGQYASWRMEIGRGLDVDPLNLVVVGSTSVGVSLSPKREKLLRPFHAGSDVDLAIISPHHFDEAWRLLRTWGPAQTLRARTRKETDLLRWHRRTLVFDGTIAAERLLPYLSFGAKWAAVLGKAGRQAPTEDRSVNARIYRDFDSLRNYHQLNVQKLKTRLQTLDTENSDDVKTLEVDK